MTDSYIAITGLLTVAAITPGPNNIIVMTRAARLDFVSTLPTILGVLIGDLLLLSLVWVSGSTAFELFPWLRPALLYCGICYLLWMGISLFISKTEGDFSAKQHAQHNRSQGILGMLVFQFLNPKAWVLMTVLVSKISAEPDPVQALFILMLCFLLIASFCLSAWALGGTLIARLLKSPQANHWFNRTMGLLLAGSALLLL